jgi:hypothetical protein
MEKLKVRMNIALAGATTGTRYVERIPKEATYSTARDA